MNYSALLDPLHDTSLDGLDFVRRAFELFELAYQLPDGGLVLRERRGDVKALLEEMLPIARYVLAHYGAGHYMSVRWLRGNQPFDAKFEARGGKVDHGVWPEQGPLEVTTAQHPNEHLMRERLNTDGSAWGLDGLRRVRGPGGAKSVESQPTSYSNFSFIHTMADLVIASIRAKTAKGYPRDTTLIVNVELNTVYLPAEWERLVQFVTNACPSHSFRCIFLCNEANQYTARI